jgi:hypothetical protein
MSALSSINDLQALFDLVVGKLSDAGVDCLLIGGFAVNHYGYTRNTLDIDWMVAADRQVVVRQIMQAAGFTNVARHEAVTFFNRPGSSLRVDFLPVDEQTMKSLLTDSVSIVFYGKTARVPSLRNLLAMKFFALAQAPERRIDKDLPDIAFLSVINELDPEWDLHPLARQYATEELFQKVCEKIKGLQ